MPDPTPTPCRCGRQTATSHPCHARGYTCPNEGSPRYYRAALVALAGAQMKAQLAGTHACDACWRAWQGAA